MGPRPSLSLRPPHEGSWIRAQIKSASPARPTTECKALHRGGMNTNTPARIRQCLDARLHISTTLRELLGFVMIGLVELMAAHPRAPCLTASPQSRRKQFDGSRDSHGSAERRKRPCHPYRCAKGGRVSFSSRKFSFLTEMIRAESEVVHTLAQLRSPLPLGRDSWCQLDSEPIAMAN